MHASGSFEVKLAPLSSEVPALGRMSIDKEYQGDLTGTGKGEMLSAMGSAHGSAAYVAIERVNGTVSGRSGSFLLHHTGVMTRGTPELSIRVVPDSGTDELVGIAGTMTIRIEGKNHFYEFNYTFG